MPRALRLGLFLIGGSIVALVLGRLFIFPHMGELKGLHHECGLQKPGVTIEQLTQKFGKPDHLKDGMGDRYQFGSDEYKTLYSEFITAYVDNYGKVVRLKCGAGIYAWKD